MHFIINKLCFFARLWKFKMLFQRADWYKIPNPTLLHFRTSSAVLDHSVLWLKAITPIPVIKYSNTLDSAIFGIKGISIASFKLTVFYWMCQIMWWKTSKNICMISKFILIKFALFKVLMHLKDRKWEKFSSMYFWNVQFELNCLTHGVNGWVKKCLKSVNSTK